MSELPIAASPTAPDLHALERIYRLDRLFRDADLGVALEIFRADPERFTRDRRPGAVRCVGRKEDGTLCGRLFVSADRQTVRRCGGCHLAEEEFAAEDWRASRWKDSTGLDFDREPTREDLNRLETELQDMEELASASSDREKDE